MLSFAMLSDPVYSRRLLLSHGVGAALMAPGFVQAASRLSPRHASANVPRVAKALPLVVLDPGHGGKDPGAIGVSGTYEKHIAFAAAGELTRLLRATGRYRVALTRENDVFIPLEERVAVAQAQGAALFMSMHADAVADHGVKGASVYTLAAEASDAQSAGLALHENAADRWAGMSAQAISPHVAEILDSLVRHETRVASWHLQQHVVQALGQRTQLLDNPARHAAFEVLKAAEIPSVLVEMGFMSNLHDEAALREPVHRANIVAALGCAVDMFFATHGQHFGMTGQAWPA